MKMILMFTIGVALVISSLNAWAADGQADMSEIGAGSKLTVLRDIRFRPNELRVWFRNGSMVERETIPDYVSRCWLEATKSSSADRILRAGKVLIVASSESGGERVGESDEFKAWVTLKVTDSSIREVTCITQASYDPKMTVGEFVKNAEGILGLEIAPPEDMD